ncbi:MAG: tetratricopeptide repeat protein, partial [Syntrophomonas sp.]
LGRYNLAYESFNSSLEATPTVFPASDIYYVLKEHILYYLGGLAEYYMNKEKALFYYLESLKQNPCQYKSLQQIIHILNPREYPQYTVQALNQVFDLSDIRLQVQLANTFYHEGAYFLALDCINRLAADKQLPENIRLLKGLCLLRSRRYKPAEQELQAINRDKDMFIKAQQYLMLYYWLQGDYPKVAGSLEKIKQAGTDPGFLAILSTFSHDSALKLEFIATVDKENHSILTEILDFLVELGSPVEIDKVWPRLFPLKHRPSQILAETLYKYKKYELAEEELRRLLAGGNLEAAAHYYLAKSCWAQGNLTDAAKFMDRAIQLGLDIPRVRWEISRIHQELAIAHLEHGLSGCPDSLELCEYLQELKEQLIEV